MKNRRDFFQKMASVAAVPAVAAVLGTSSARADDGDVKEFVGSWSMLHEGPDGYFREFISFADGGVVTETNSFLHTASDYDFSKLGFPMVLNASDGFGNWRRVGKGRIFVAFRKMIFNRAKEYIADLHVTGTLLSDGSILRTDDSAPGTSKWLIQVVTPQDVDDPKKESTVLQSFGYASSKGVRIR